MVILIICVCLTLPSLYSWYFKVYTLILLPCWYIIIVFNISVVWCARGDVSCCILNHVSLCICTSFPLESTQSLHSNASSYHYNSILVHIMVVWCTRETYLKYSRLSVSLYFHFSFLFNFGTEYTRGILYVKLNISECQHSQFIQFLHITTLVYTHYSKQMELSVFYNLQKFLIDLIGMKCSLCARLHPPHPTNAIIPSVIKCPKEYYRTKHFILYTKNLKRYIENQNKKCFSFRKVRFL